MKKINIAIEGPVASGKGTVAWRLAQLLNYDYIDTGAMYRSVSYVCNQAGIDKKDEVRVTKYVKNIHIEYKKPTPGSSERCAIYIDGKEITPYIRTVEMAEYSSYAGGYNAVRAKVIAVQKELIKNKGVVVEGQAMIDEIMPDAELKVYLTADEQVRAYRRWLDHNKRGETHTVEEILEALRKRDLHDSTKEFGRMKVHPEAIVIDSTNMSVDEVVNSLYAEAAKLINKNS
jgi:cytidylate kinase